MGGSQATALAPEQRRSTGLPDSNTKSGYNAALGYLRASVILQVVLVHAALAYCNFVPFLAGRPLTLEPRAWLLIPVMDSHRWVGFNLIFAWGDTFLIALMFFVSGLFTWGSLSRKGSVGFLRERVLRLALPFAVSVVLLAPIAYYPAYLQTTSRPSIGEYIGVLRSLGELPAGSAWFLWVLLVFDCLTAASFALVGARGERLFERLSGVLRRPVLFFVVLTTISAAVYVPLALAFNPINWLRWGPFQVQTPRILHYVVYFLAGIAVGGYGIDRSFLMRDGRLARRWDVWGFGAVIVFLASKAVATVAAKLHPGSLTAEAAGAVGLALACAALSLAYAAALLRFAKRTQVLESLRENAYGIYLLHYSFVSWLQYALLHSALPLGLKWITVSTEAVLLSWGASAALRKLPAVAKVV